MLEQARRVRTEVIREGPVADSDGLQSGYVNRYLDSQGIYNRFEALHNQYPALTQWTDLPYVTSGYDGSNTLLAGPGRLS